jgi:sugar lactone lactonase YvrE
MGSPVGAGGAPVGGASGIGGTAASGGTAGGAGGSRPVTYPPLKFSDIGKPALVSGQFLFTEGPIWDLAKQVLYFTDINADTIYRLTLPSTVDVFLKPMQKADGLALDPQGNLIGAGFVSRSVWRLAGTSIQPLASTYQNKKLNSPDDLIARSDGVIYFTDPLYGIDGSQGLAAQTQELGFQSLFRLTSDGVLHQEDQSTSGPNGVELSPDEQSLYLSYTSTGQVYVFAVAADGALSGKKLFATGISIADSMCVDAGGNVYVASLGGIVVLDPAGTRLGAVAMSQVPTNCAFGGNDQRTLFITARTGLLGAPAAGNASLYRIDSMPIPGMPGRP